MSTIVSASRGGRCGLCQYDFTPEKEQVTHKGGEGHDGFDPECLKEYVVIKNLPYPPCPYSHCKMPIDPRLLFSRTEWIVNKLKLSVINVACVAYLTAATAAATEVVGLLEDSLRGRLVTPVLLALGTGIVIETGKKIVETGITIETLKIGIFNGIDLILEDRVFRMVDRENIVYGLIGGNLIKSSPLAVALISSVTTAVLSLIRR